MKPKLVWYHGEDYESQARKHGYTLREKASVFEHRYRSVHHSFINGYMTYTQYIAELKKIEKDLNKSVESYFSLKARLVHQESCYLDQGITQC